EVGALAGAVLNVTTAGTASGLILELHYIPRDPSLSGSLITFPYQLGRWIRLEVDFTFGPDAAHRRIQTTVDGVAQPPFEFTNGPGDYAGTYSGDLTIGSFADGQALPSTEAEYDDVVVWQM